MPRVPARAVLARVGWSARRNAGFGSSLCAFNRFPDLHPQVTPAGTLSSLFCGQPLHFQKVPAAGTSSNLAAPEPGDVSPLLPMPKASPLLGCSF